MKRSLATACALFAFGFASAALADGQVTATLAQPMAGHAKLVAGQAVFRCEGTSCVAATAPDAAGSLSNCKLLAKQVGALTAYGAAKPLDDAKLAECNLAAAKSATTTASR
jgi:hypothetical protein